MEFTKIDRKSADVLAALAVAPVFKKQGTVKARQAAEGEQVATVMASGHTETTNTAKAGDWVVTNPNGEQYVIGSEKFESRYEATEESGVYAARGYCRAIENPFGYSIEIMASWGSPQSGDEKCMIADTCDVAGILTGEPYLIEAEAFAKTYALV